MNHFPHYSDMDVSLNSFVDSIFDKLSLNATTFHKKTFENCTFKNSDFQDSKFISCKFVDCTFESCNLANIDIQNSFFTTVIFEKSKVIGVNWARAKWPLINLTCSIQFYECNISESSFFELELIEMIMQGCKAHNVDFRGTNLSRASFVSTNFQNSLFLETNLDGADFTEAYDYNIHPNKNNIKHAKFSFPEVLSLLNHFEIEIEGI